MVSALENLLGITMQAYKL